MKAGLKIVCLTLVWCRG